MEMLSSWWGGGSAEPKEEGKIESKDDEASATEKPTDVVVENEPGSESQLEGEEKSPVSDTDAAITTAKEWGSYLYNFAKEGTMKVAEQATKTASAIQKTVEEKTIVGDFNKEQEKFVKEKHSKRSEAAVPPWVGYNEEDTMKEQIMALSQDKRNFLRNPPAGVQFHFEFEHMFPIAMATLQEDERLQKMRFELVPKQVTEENFWRNYFYRVSLIKQSSQLTSLANASGEQSSKTDSSGKKPVEETETESRKDKSAPVSIGGVASQSTSKTSESEDADMPPDSPPGTEFVSDAFNSELDQAELQKGMEQLGMDKKDSKENTGTTDDDIPEWEKELQQELQDYEVVDEDGGGNEEWEKEIDQMLEEEVQEESK
ncbi:synapse-associated protein 1-like isoform X3 [Amphiura filiformis]|uniref:synapse-associated protein 1-like isoform X3 n=1 Tax=Amphiura filiformis TaxID=82378 RepID=UPI003B214FB8